MAIRKPIVAGSFYPAEKKELERFVKKNLAWKKENIFACIVPHAGYMFSGKLAGKVLGKFRDKKDFILLGVNHSGIGNKISFSLEDFETPFGIVKNNKALSEKILKKLKKEKLDAEINETAHVSEHSIEVELPFLQLSQKRFEIVPILLKGLSYEECKKTAEILSSLIDENVGLIVSSDFTHAGISYGFDIGLDKARDIDEEVIFNILQKDSEKVYELASKTTICDLYGLTIITEIAKIKKWKVERVDYYTSADITGDEGVAVGYAGLVFS